MAGSSTVRKNALNIVQLNSDAVRGSQEDAAISINSQGGASAPWLYGLEFGSPSSQWSFGTDSILVGAVIRAYGVNPSFIYNTAQFGVDWRSVNFSSGGAAFCSNGFAVDPNGNTSAYNITLSGIISAAVASLVSITVINGGAYTTKPQLIIQPPAASGSAATAIVSTMVAVNSGQISFGNTGSGYVSGDTVTLSGGTGTAPTYTITASGGAVTSLMLASAGSLSSLPNFPASFSGGSGSGLTATVGFAIATVSVVSTGSGYTPGAVPLVITSLTPYYAANLLAVMSTPISKTLILNNGGGDVQIGSGTSLATTAKTGLLKIPFMNGAPTATPTNADGPALVWNDSTKTLNVFSQSAGVWYHIAASSGAG